MVWFYFTLWGMLGGASGLAALEAHLSDDKTVAKMGHPDLWSALAFGDAVICI